MNEKIAPTTTPLEQWAPGCAMREWWPEGLPPCNTKAELAVVWHNNCHTTISCPDCYLKFFHAAKNWASVYGPSGVCSGCDGDADLSTLRVVAL